MGHSRPIQRVLFLCKYNRSRSATAERVFCKRPDLDVRSAGTNEDALVRVNQRMLDWADVIFTMEAAQQRALQRMFPSYPGLKKLVCLEITDDFAFLDPELVKVLKERVTPHLARPRKTADSE